MTLFSGLRVVELGSGMAVPMAGMILADYAADVVKIEHPRGDWARDLPAFQMWNRGKRSIVLDLEDGAQRLEAHRLAATADVLLVGLRPGAAARFGLDYEALAELNPRLVYGSISAFADVDELAGLKGYEACVAGRVGQWIGLDEVQGLRSGADPATPIFKLVPINAYGAAQCVTQAVIAALLVREHSGRGQYVRTSLMQAAMALMMRQTLLEGEHPGRHSDDLVHAGIRLTFLTVECRDGRWLQMCARQDHHFSNWLLAMGMNDAAEDPRYRDGPLRIPTMSAIDELSRRIRARMRERDQHEWMQLFIEQYDVGADPVLRPDEFLSHPQVSANGLVTEIETPSLGSVEQPARLVRFAGEPARPLQPAPPLGSTKSDHVWPEIGAPTLRSPHERPGLPLAGVTILEIAYFLAAPLAPAILAEMGARVIKVEPLAGDPWRRVGLEAIHLLHGKESIAVDLKTPNGTTILQRLIAASDALLTNFRPGVPERLGFGAQASLELNPSLVYVYASSYGSLGPESHRAAFHSTPSALNGTAILQGGSGNAPVDDSYPDPCSGLGAATALMLGLAARQRYGRGMSLETTMLASAAYAASPFLVRYPGSPAPRGNDGTQSGTDALHHVYPCARGWVVVSIRTQSEWEETVRGLGGTVSVDDPRFCSADARAKYDLELQKLLEEAFAARPAAEWARLARGRNIPLVRGS
jgi:crotonobetainyl-CoA:carnitine CoA-transferase CaiB-like acyl-CoA transferase